MSKEGKWTDLPVLVMIISVFSAWNFCQSSLFSRVTWTPLAGGATGRGGALRVGSSIRGPSIDTSKFLNTEPVGRSWSDVEDVDLPSGQFQSY